MNINSSFNLDIDFDLFHKYVNYNILLYYKIKCMFSFFLLFVQQELSYSLTKIMYTY